jgi:FxsC-like protein
VSLVFMSYARSDVDPYFETFYRDFVRELRGCLGNNSTDNLVFRDSSDIPLGARWEPTIERRLLDCRVFVAMVSPTYLRRRACSKEWASVEWRLQHGDSESPSALLLPLKWIPVLNDDVPSAVRERQAVHVSLGNSYARRGLRHVVQRAGAEYHELLTALAERVRDAVRAPAPQAPAELMAPDQLPDLFGLDASPIAIHADPLKPPGGPKHVEFIVVAARQDELAAERNVTVAYGSEFDEWRPYLPKLDTRIGLLVQKVALEQNLTAGVAAVAHNIVSHLQGARTRNTLAVLLVDVWSLQLERYRGYMKLFDSAERLANAGVLVVWNLGDGETPARREALLDGLRFAFPNLTVVKDPLAFHEQIGTHDELIAKLRDTLQILRRRIIEFGSVIRKAEGIAPIAQPLLIGPGAAP